jgi:hypothetical protein
VKEKGNRRQNLGLPEVRKLSHKRSCHTKRYTHMHRKTNVKKIMLEPQY